jgi:S-formylglutathione hydrolase FrmB
MKLADLAKQSKFRQVCVAFPPGGHDFQFWTQAFKDSLPWMAWQLGLTPPPASVPSRCEPPIH